MKRHDMNKIVEDLKAELVGMKGRREAKAFTENYLERVTGQEHTFQAYRDTYHHYHIVQNEGGGGDSLFVSFSGSKVKDVSKY